MPFSILSVEAVSLKTINCVVVFSFRFSSLCYKNCAMGLLVFIVQELCESRGGRPGLSVLTSLLVSVDVKNY